MQKLLENCSNNYPPHNSNYAALINKLADNSEIKVTFITFNYDTLLERALSKYVNPKLGTDERTIGDYLKGNIPLIKLHGSINWSYKIPTPNGVDNEHQWLSERIEVLAKLNPDDIGIRSPTGTFMYFIDSDGDDDLVPQMNFPALSIPVSSDKHFSCPTTHLDTAIEAIKEANHLVTIGWRGNEEHFMGLLKTHCLPEHLTVVSQTEESAERVIQHLQKYVTTKGHRGIGGGFSGFTQMFNQSKLGEYLQNYQLQTQAE